MKKLAALVLSLVLAMSMVACGEEDTPAGGTAGGTSSATTSMAQKPSDTKVALLDTLSYRVMNDWTSEEKDGKLVYTCGTEGTYTVKFTEKAGVQIVDIKDPLAAEWKEVGEYEIVKESIEQINGSMTWVLRRTVTPAEGKPLDVMDYVIITDNGYAEFEFAAEEAISPAFEKDIKKVTAKYRRANAADKKAAEEAK